MGPHFRIENPNPLFVMSRSYFMAVVSAGLLISLPAADTVTTAIYARVDSGYKRERLKDGPSSPSITPWPTVAASRARPAMSR
jgi:hypothetical protein